MYSFFRLILLTKLILKREKFRLQNGINSFRLWWLKLITIKK